ncbi:hypothetical protein PR048_011835 [Dryococelus australis]|uniref:Uncharacterized protein n=1 Tax=Dryococelus australis TaxID=614101 RepID=A0ABQ9HN09_9NEOP|nr:hypothetical protein PR048_011835 [Dryococelus australis]
MRTENPPWRNWGAISRPSDYKSTTLSLCYEGRSPIDMPRQRRLTRRKYPQNFLVHVRSTHGSPPIRDVFVDSSRLPQLPEQAVMIDSVKADKPSYRLFTVNEAPVELPSVRHGIWDDYATRNDIILGNISYEVCQSVCLRTHTEMKPSRCRFACRSSLSDSALRLRGLYHSVTLFFLRINRHQNFSDRKSHQVGTAVLSILNRSKSEVRKRGSHRGLMTSERYACVHQHGQHIPPSGGLNPTAYDVYADDQCYFCVDYVARPTTVRQYVRGGCGGVVFAFHQDEYGSIPGKVVPDLRRWESCWTMPLVGGFSQGYPVSLFFHSGAAPY